MGKRKPNKQDGCLASRLGPQQRNTKIQTTKEKCSIIDDEWGVRPADDNATLIVLLSSFCYRPGERCEGHDGVGGSDLRGEEKNKESETSSGKKGPRQEFPKK